jgi:hypothetical protein
MLNVIARFEKGDKVYFCNYPLVRSKRNEDDEFYPILEGEVDYAEVNPYTSFFHYKVFFKFGYRPLAEYELFESREACIESIIERIEDILSKLKNKKVSDERI